MSKHAKSEGRHAKYWFYPGFVAIRHPSDDYIGKHRKEN